VDVTSRLALALRTLRRVPVILNVHDPDPHSSERNWRKSLSRRLAFPAVDRFVLFNETQRAAFARRTGIDPQRVSVARFGTFDLLRHWDRDAAPGEPIVLFFGRLSEYKGLDTFLAAMTMLSERVPDLRVVVAGRPVAGYTVPPMPRLARGGSIELLDRYIDNSEVNRLFRRAAVVACPYHDATQSGIILTALGFRVPVVATRVGGIPEYLEDGVTGSLIPERDPGALASAVERILTDPSYAVGLREGIDRVERTHLHWDRMADDLVKTYADTLRPG
jgi:glycosyltransferase involved in cell wall biosynthesis